jgi:L-asparaginase
MATAKVLVIYTGGTIGMVPADARDPASPLRPGGPEPFLRAVANPLDGVAWEMVALADGAGGVLPPLDSSDVGPRHWAALAAQVAAAYERYDGFVVLHGTDTMAYSASALSFLLENLGKPVVFTGSQLPILASRSDAPGNLANALAIAGWPSGKLPCIPEVVIAFADVVLRGNRATKISTGAYRGFASPNHAPLARLGLDIAIDTARLRPRPDPATHPFRAHDRLAAQVMDISLYPGITAGQLAAILAIPGVDGYVLRCFGAGNAPGEPGLLAALHDAVTAGRLVVAVKHCPEGAVEMGVYAAGTGLLRQGVLPGADMTAEAALAKLIWLLDRYGPAEAAARVGSDCRGELSP